MENMGLVQARTPEKVKSEATDILDRLGLNMSSYINMALNQLIIQGGVPFAVTTHVHPYGKAEMIDEVKATLAMEGMDLKDEDVKMLAEILSGDLTADEARQRVLSEARNVG